MRRRHRSGSAWEEFLDLWAELRERASDPRCVLVVEGERDVHALRRLGVVGRVVPIHRGQRIAAVARAIDDAADRAILLTDWDAEGGHLAHRLAELLAPGTVEVDLDLRRRLARCLRGEIVHVEGLYSWARHSAEREGAPLDHFLPPADGAGIG